MKRISIEEHFATEKYVEYMCSIVQREYPVREVIEKEKYIDFETQWLPVSKQHKFVSTAGIVANRLLDLGEGRLQQMAEAGIDMQVLSLVSPGVQALDASTGIALARETNNRLSQVVKKFPTKFAGFATLAPQSPEESADELERAVRELGLMGASINSHTRGEYLDEHKFWPIFERAQKLGVPIYIHPRVPSPDMVKPYLDQGYPMLHGSMCGYGAEVSLHAVRLMCSGVFEEYPELNIILGHLGEALPYLMWRINNSWSKTPLAKKFKKTPIGYMKENIYVTTSGNFWQPALICAYLALGADRILFAVDYPMESCQEAVAFVERAPICDNDKERIFHLNAEKLLSLIPA